MAQEKSKRALIDGQVPSSLRSSFSISRASTISRGHRRLNPPPPPLHPPISSFACTRHMELETNRAPVPLASSRPVLLPRKQPNGSRRERSAPARRVLDRGRSAVRNHYLILGTPPRSTCQILSCPSAKDVPLSQPLREKYLHVRPRDRARQPDRSISSRNETHGIGWWQRTQLWPASAEFDEAAAPGMETRHREGGGCGCRLASDFRLGRR